MGCTAGPFHFATLLNSLRYPRSVIPTGGIMGLRPTQGNEKRLGPATTLYGAVTLPLSSRAQPRDLQFFPPATNAQLEVELSSRPKRTQISYLAALATATYAPFRRERRMKCASATKFHRKSGGAEWRDLLFPRFPGNVFSTERTQISYLEALATATYAPFRRERRMKLASATKFHRKSGGA
jgi:hypothetical protein